MPLNNIKNVIYDSVVDSGDIFSVNLGQLSLE